MAMSLRILSFIGLSALLFCCKKDDKNVGESPFFDFFATSAIEIDTVEQAGDTWEYGFTFSPLKPGKITELGVKLPTTGSFLVTFWEVSGANSVALKSQIITTSAQHEATFFDIADISLSTQKKYGITLLADAFYRITQTGNTPFAYPKTVGNIQIESFVESVNNSTEASLPTTTNDTRVAPCVDVIFIAD